MTQPLSIAMAQLNPTVGDIKANLALALKAFEEASAEGADLVVFTELLLAGYPAEDLVLRLDFQAACYEALNEFAQATKGSQTASLIGLPLVEGGKLYNAVAMVDGGEVTATRLKRDLPNYGVFDEKRVFATGPLPEPIDFRGVKIGVPICEDIWNDEICAHLYARGAEVLIVPNGSPFHKAKHELRMEVVRARLKQAPLPMVYVNQVGGQDELVFDGGSFAINKDGVIAAQAPFFQTAVEMVRLENTADGWQVEQGHLIKDTSQQAQLYQACMLGLRDYVNKNGFKSVVLGLSGGIDSALVAALATDALGADRVHCVMLPYRYTSSASLKDAEDCAQALGVRYDTLPIEAAVQGLSNSLAPLFHGLKEDVTEENLQSRARGTMLMALSNKFGSMVVTTGNKSEMSVGYATLYGDMNGGFNPLKDLYKMEVYALSDWRNRFYPKGGLGPSGLVIPQNIIDKAPSAELRDNQTDQDSLPPYPVLDAVLEALVEDDKSIEQVVALGFERETVLRVAKLLRIAEYKRRQSAPGVKVTRRNFGRDRRYPITNGFREH